MHVNIDGHKNRDLADLAYKIENNEKPFMIVEIENNNIVVNETA